MVNIKMKSVVDMKMTGAAKSHARTDIAVRDVASVIDEPEVRGGTNQGLTPTETLVASLVGCTNVITQRIAHGMDVKIADLKIDAAAKFDRRGVSLEEEIEVPFPSVVLNIDIQTDASAHQITAIQRDLKKFCPIAKVIRNAGTTIDENWTVR
ncbi:MAG: OsmC family protein, partial [Burkholderiaceae bacterium]